MILEGDESNTGVHTQKHVQERKYEKHELKIALWTLFLRNLHFSAKSAKKCLHGFVILFYP